MLFGKICARGDLKSNSLSPLNTEIVTICTINNNKISKAKIQGLFFNNFQLHHFNSAEIPKRYSKKLRNTEVTDLVHHLRNHFITINQVEFINLIG